MTVFDKYAKNYDEGHAKAVAMSGFEPSYFHEYKIKEIRSYLNANGLADKKLTLLNFGCGTGSSEKHIRRYLPNVAIYGVDVSEESVKVARETNSEFDNMTFAPFDGIHIPFDIKFDIIFVANVFHHIRRDKHAEVLKNLHDKLTDSGLLFIFELNPINPLTMLVALRNDYRFDKDARLLCPTYARKILSAVGFKKREIRFTVFFPQFLSFLIPLEKYLYKLPLGAHYYYIAKKL